MKIICSIHQRFLLNTNLSSPLKPTPPILKPTRKWKKIHAKPKGFSGDSISKSLPKETSTVPKRSFQKNDKNEDDDEIPQVVYNRMIVRILVYVGVPLVTGLVLLQGFSVVKEENIVSVPIWLPYFTTFLTFGASALGIAIGTLSTSWDEDVEGSFFGFEEAQKNWVEMWKEDDDNERTNG